jgi:hypothetical protein
MRCSAAPRREGRVRWPAVRISPGHRGCDRVVTVFGERSTVVLRELFSLPLASAALRGDRGPSLLLAAPDRALRLRRVLPATGTGRDWLLEVEVDVPAIDPEQLLLRSEGFLVDGSNGAAIGVVERAESSGDPPAVSALVVAAGWFGRRRLRVDATAIEALLPEERLLIVDESRLTPVHGDDA